MLRAPQLGKYAASRWSMLAVQGVQRTLAMSPGEVCSLSLAYVRASHRKAYFAYFSGTSLKILLWGTVPPHLPRAGGMRVSVLFFFFSLYS